jgi:hypothetical protein
MKFYHSIVSIILINLSMSQSHAQLDSVTVDRDSLSMSPFNTMKKVRYASTYQVLTSDENIFHAYAGTSVFNVLRGLVPAYSISPSVQFTGGAGFRRENAMTVIDGVPLNADISDYYNLNAFEYSSIGISSPNGTALYGNLGSNGGIFLRSKTGEGVDRPSIEFNSYTTRNFADSESPYQSLIDGNDSWMFSNAVAYAQDFGSVDTRVSYNYSTFPVGGDQYDGSDRTHSIRINSGLKLADRFSARVILDYRKNKYEGNRESTYSQNPPITARSESTFSKNYVQGNILLTYQVLRNLSIVSQHTFSKASTDLLSVTTTPSTQTIGNETDEKRRLNNLLASFERKIRHLHVRLSAGAQHEKYKVHQSSRMTSNFSDSGSDYWIDMKTFSWLGKLDLSLDEVLFIHGDVREEKLESNAEKSFTTYVLGGSFVLTNAFNVSPEKAFVKLRTSFGKYGFDSPLNFPLDATLGVTDSGVRPPSRKVFDIGTDLDFLSDRIGLSFSYFKMTDDELWVESWSPWGPPLWISLGSLVSDGVELSMKAKTIRNERIMLQHTIAFQKAETRIESEHSGGSDDFDFPTTTPPDWTTSFLNYFKTGRLFVSGLVDITKGGQIVQYNFYPQPTTTIIKREQIRVRDLTIGVNLGVSRLEQFHIRALAISLSARNMITLKSASGADPEYVDLSSMYLRSMSASLTARF